MVTTDLFQIFPQCDRPREDKQTADCGMALKRTCSRILIQLLFLVYLHTGISLVPQPAIKRSAVAHTPLLCLCIYVIRMFPSCALYSTTVEIPNSNKSIPYKRNTCVQAVQRSNFINHYSVFVGLGLHTIVQLTSSGSWRWLTAESKPAVF